MKKSIKILSIFIMFLVIFFPFNKIYAATYNTYRVQLGNITNATACENGKCKISSSNSHEFYSDYYFNFHEVRDGNNVYLGYCLHAGLSVPGSASVTKVTDFNKLYIGKKQNRELLTPKRKQLLMNILASGYQKTNIGGRSVLNGDLLNSTSGIKTTCRNKTACKKILATQILVWEVMEKARSNYNEKPNNLANNTYAYVKKDSDLYKEYVKILQDAKSLTDSAEQTIGKTYIMNWHSDKYYSELIDIGEYNVDKDSLPNGVSVSKKNSNNQVRIYSTKQLKESLIKLKLVKGSTSNDAADFRWYSFGNDAYQDVVMGDYKIEKTAYIKVYTEVGYLKIKKQDENSNNLLGSKFDIFKCYDKICTDTKKVTSVDLTKKAESDKIKLTKSGKYLIVETKTPPGHESIRNFSITISIDEFGKTIVTQTSKPDNVSITDNVEIAILNIYNIPKSIKISKIDGHTQKGVKGASFEIYSANNTLLKFKKYKSGNSYYYKYNTTGEYTTLTESNFDTYTVSALPDGEYYVKETAVPYPYVLTGLEQDRITKFKIEKSLLKVYNYKNNKYENSPSAKITLKNYKTEFKIIKKGNNNTTLEGVEFELYKSDKTSLIKLNKVSSGIYEYSDNASETTLITDSNGSIVVRYLPAGTYWMKEVKAADNYPSADTLPDEVKWHKIEVKVNRYGQTSPSAIYEWPNAKGEFCFYKIDEDGNYLNDGKFKIQSYDDKSNKYVDTALIYNSDNKNYSFDVTGKSDIYTFSPISNGQTCFINANTKGKYRIVEVEAPEGFELGSVSDTSAEFNVNDDGYVIGNTTIINKKITKGEGADSQAELVINISTGQTVIKYGLIITVIVAAIIGLLILNKKMSKK